MNMFKKNNAKENSADKEKFMDKVKASLGTRSFKVGGYSVIACLIVLAIAVVINIVVGALPETATKLDTSSSGLYSLSDESKDFVKGLEQDITIYWVVQSGNEDATIENMLDRYDDLSKKLSVEKIDPDVYPTFLDQYMSGEDTVYNNSLVVESGDTFKYLAYDSIYEYDYSNYYTTGSYDVSFAGESVITSALKYVTSGELGNIYALTGHGEASLSGSMKTAVLNQNYQITDLSLLTQGSVPEDADFLLIYSPASDISTDEENIILSYLQNGGKMLLITDPQSSNSSLPNLEAVMEYYGVYKTSGLVIDSDGSYAYYNMPYALLPALNSSHDITSPLSDAGYHVLLPVAEGLTVSDSLRDNESVTKLLTTSDSAISKAAGVNLTTYDKEDGDTDGPFALAVAVTETVDNGETGIVWVSSGAIADSDTNESVSGGNEDFLINAISWLSAEEGETAETTIHAKNLDYTYLTMSSGTVTALAMIMVIIIPLLVLAAGIIIVVRRRRR